MAKRKKTENLSVVPVLPIIGAVTAGKVLAIAVAGAAGLYLAKKNGDGSTTPPPQDPAKNAANVKALVTQANGLFVGALASANALVTTSGVLSSLGIQAAMQAPLQASASATVSTAWLRLSDTDKVYLMTGGGKATSAKNLGGLGLTINNPFRTSSGSVPGCTNPAPGLQSIVCWAAQGIADNIHKQMLGVCGNIDKVIAALKAKGAPIPNMSGWSCDQKVAFVAALSPGGIAVLLAGALVGALAVNTVSIVKNSLSQASKAVSDISKKLGVKVPDLSIPKVGGTTEDIIDSVFGLGGFTSSPMPLVLVGSALFAGAGYWYWRNGGWKFRGRT